MIGLAVLDLAGAASLADKSGIGRKGQNLVDIRLD